MAEIFNMVLATGCAVLGGTFLTGLVKTFLEGPEAIAAFDRAGFTWSNFRRGTVPPLAEGGSSATIGHSAEIAISGNAFHARPTRTVVKEHS